MTLIFELIVFVVAVGAGTILVIALATVLVEDELRLYVFF